MLKSLVKWLFRKRRGRQQTGPARPGVESIEPRLLLAGNGLSATYFDNPDFTGQSVSRIDHSINFAFPSGAAPVAGIAANTFSARWTGQFLTPRTETITFYTVSDDGVRLWVNGQKLIDNWNNHPAMENKAAFAATAGKSCSIKLEYYNNYGGGAAKLLWSSPSVAKQVIPTSQLYSAPVATPALVPAPAAAPAPVAGNGNGLLATYFNTGNLIGASVTRTDAAVDFNWGTGSPAAGIPADNFSARWTGQVLAPVTQDYTFSTFSDDGVRLWVNGQKLIDNWTPHALTENTGKIHLEAGKKYDLKMEYFERASGAAARLLWSGPATPKQVIPKSQLFSSVPVPPAAEGPQPVPPAAGAVVNGLMGTYFATTTFSGSSITRVDRTVGFDWGTGSPQEIIGSDGWSARWTGQVLAAKSETYRFYLFSDEGARMWVNGQLIINDWTPHARRESSGAIALQAGRKYDVVIEYFDKTGDAVMQLKWSSPSTPKQLVPAASLFCAMPVYQPIPGVPAAVPFTGYKVFGSSQVNFRPSSATDKTLTIDGYRLSRLPMNAKGLNIATTAVGTTAAWAYRTITVRNTEISDVYRTAGYHNDFIRIAGVAGRQDTLMNVVLENVTLHDGSAVPILITDGDYDTIVIRNVKITSTTLNQLQINTQQVGSVKRIIVENSPGLGVAIIGRQGTIGECLVRNSPGARVADSLNQQGTKSGVKITILP